MPNQLYQNSYQNKLLKHIVLVDPDGKMDFEVNQNITMQCNYHLVLYLQLTIMNFGSASKCKGLNFLQIVPTPNKELVKTGMRDQVILDDWLHT